MSLLIAPPEPMARALNAAGDHGVSRVGRRQRRRVDRRRIKRQDALSRRLAELHSIRLLLGQAAEVVDTGWVQGAWFTVAAGGGSRSVTAYDLVAAVEQPITGACLVGAVVSAAGGPTNVQSQLVQRSLDVVWHALREDPARPVRWCPGPCVRMMHVLDLTFWNDAAGRTQGEVVHLLLAAREVADGERDACLAEQKQLAASAGR